MAALLSAIDPLDWLVRSRRHRRRFV